MFVSRVASLLALSACFLHVATARAQDKCFKRLDTGVDMAGWHRSTTNHHGPGTGWTIEGGAFVGRQTAGNQGGIMMTDQTYKDVEVIFEVKIDWGCDSGFFFRTTGGDRAYQVNVDHLQDAGVGTIYGEGFSQELRYRPYYLTDNGMTALKDPVLTPIFDLTKWSTIWKPTDFNEIHARVEGNPPHMQVWISGLKVMDFTDTMLRPEIDAVGPLAIQVHGGAARWTPTGSVSFRNIRVKDLTVACVDDGTGGAGGASGSGGAGAAAGSAGAAGTAPGGAGAAGAVATGGQAAGSGGAASGGASATSGAGGVPPSTIPNEGVANASGSAAAPNAASTGGCGCRTTNSRSSGTAPTALLLLAFAARRRGRSALK